MQMLHLEQRRTERSGRPFLLILISGEGLQDNLDKTPDGGVIASVSACIRETDVFGWYEQPSTLGLLMTEIGDASTNVIEAIVSKISIVLQRSLSAEA